MPDSVWVINILVVVLLAVSGFFIKQLYRRFDKQEERIEKIKDYYDKEIKDLYMRHDNKHSELRSELAEFAKSIREEIQKQYSTQTELLVSALKGAMK